MFSYVMKVNLVLLYLNVHIIYFSPRRYLTTLACPVEPEFKVVRMLVLCSSQWFAPGRGGIGSLSQVH